MTFTTAESIMFSTLQVFELDKSLHTTGAGTGFIMSFDYDDGTCIPVLVTNRHVLSGTHSIALILTYNDGGKPDLGNTKTVILPSSDAIFHPNDNIDLAILPIGPKITELEASGFFPFLSFLPAKLIPTEEQWATFDAIETVVTVGYPEGLRDKVNNLPIMRSGITATHPAYDFQGKPEFLIDLPCFQGCSGSPVFIYNMGTYTDPRKKQVNVGSRIYFLGVLRAIQTVTKKVEQSSSSEQPNAEASTYTQALDLGCIIKSTELLVFDQLLRGIGT